MQMERYFKVIYKDYEKSLDTYREVIKEATVPWGDDIYDDRVSYRDNLEFVLIGIFDTGFVEVSPSKFISASCILNVEGCSSNEVSNLPQRQEDNRQGQGHKREQKFNRKVRRFGKDQLRQSRNNLQVKTPTVTEAPPKPEPPPNVLVKESQDLSDIKKEETQ